MDDARSVPTLGDILAQVRAVAAAGYSADARHAASRWAAEWMASLSWPDEFTDVGWGLTTLGMADLLADMGGNFLYGPEDFAAWEDDLLKRGAV